MQKPSQVLRLQHEHPKHVLSERKHISIYFSTEVDPRGDTLSPVDYSNGRVDPSRPFSSFLSLSSCLHPSVAWLGSPPVTMATRTGAAWWGLRSEKRRGIEERKSPPAVPYQQQKPWGNLIGETKRQDFIPNFLSHTNIFCLQNQPWHVLLSPPLLSQSSAPLSCPPLPALPLSCSLLFQPFLPLFFCLSSSSLHLYLSPLHAPEWISNDSGLVHSGEGEL